MHIKFWHGGVKFYFLTTLSALGSSHWAECMVFRLLVRVTPLLGQDKEGVDRTEDTDAVAYIVFICCSQLAQMFFAWVSWNGFDPDGDIKTPLS